MVTGAMRGRGKGRGRGQKRGPPARADSRYNLRPLNPKGPDLHRLRMDALAKLRYGRGLVSDDSGILKPDDPGLKGIKGIEVAPDGGVYKLDFPDLPEDDDTKGILEISRPFAEKALELHCEKEGASFELVDMLRAKSQMWLYHCLIWHIKFTAKPVGSPAGSTTTTFFAQVHEVGYEVHASLCFTIDSPTVTSNPRRFIIQDGVKGAWVVSFSVADYPFDCPSCRLKKRKKGARN
ncbi:hypothetical protein Tsubulata_018868 [Turnera subulata]|uniref:DUF3615 domain-containing protein n=1 Tax=Turnera subulata TaxID=218843 RepID=A0A9Q0JAD2_9ROSI|nr:hypothetical protein Tsubulata_018868 [Turnera subulata]